MHRHVGMRGVGDFDFDAFDALSADDFDLGASLFDAQSFEWNSIALPAFSTVDAGMPIIDDAELTAYADTQPVINVTALEEANTTAIEDDNSGAHTQGEIGPDTPATLDNDTGKIIDAATKAGKIAADSGGKRSQSSTMPRSNSGDVLTLADRLLTTAQKAATTNAQIEMARARAKSPYAALLQPSPVPGYGYNAAGQLVPYNAASASSTGFMAMLKANPIPFTLAGIALVALVLPTSKGKRS